MQDKQMKIRPIINTPPKPSPIVFGSIKETIVKNAHKKQIREAIYNHYQQIKKLQEILEGLKR